MLAPWSSSRPITGVIWCSKADLEWPLQGHFNFLKCGLKEQVYPEKEIVWLEIDHQLFDPDNFSAFCCPKHIFEGKDKDLWRRIPHVYEKDREGEGEKNILSRSRGEWE